MPDWRPALVALVPGIVVMQNWLRLEDPQRDAGRAVLILALAVAPALASRLWQRLVLLALAFLVTVDLAARVPLLHPWHASDRSWNGFLDFYEIRLPFNPFFHPEMHILLLLAGFGFTAGLALAASSRRPVVAVALLVVGAGWPATLLTDGRDLLRGAVILATALFLLAALRAGARRTLARAALLGACARRRLARRDRATRRREERVPPLADVESRTSGRPPTSACATSGMRATTASPGRARPRPS